MKLTASQPLHTTENTLSKTLCLAVLPKGGFRKELNKASFPLYWLNFSQPNLDDVNFNESTLGQALSEILVDNILEELWCSTVKEKNQWMNYFQKVGFLWFAEKQFLPGVTDNLARTIEEALRLKSISSGIQVTSGQGYLFKDPLLKKPDIEQQACYTLFHPIIECFRLYNLENTHDTFLDFPEVHLGNKPKTEFISLDLDDEGLLALSQNRLLALNLEEMQAIKSYFQQESVRTLRLSYGLQEWPSDVELEIIAQTWSEHCKHKIFNASITYTDESLPDKQNTSTIDSLYKTYIQGPTYELKKERQDLLSVFEDNSGVVKWNNEYAVCFKVETHNSPSALEPYGGALTGILGVNRDIYGTGLGARPLFNTDIFCFAYPSYALPVRPKLLPAQTIMQGVRKGVQDGGNKSGIPTVNGAIFFHDGYRAKPLVFCGTGGILPLTVCGQDAINKHTSCGDFIVMLGGRVGKDGIHGATFSSQALEEHSPVSAVQIGDPFTQKRLLDLVLKARDQGLITGITDNGAGGLSSSVGEMARITDGAKLALDNIPLKSPGLADYEIVISESQERMTVSTKDPEKLCQLANLYNVEATTIGTFTDDSFFTITSGSQTVALLNLEFLHKGLPKMELKAVWQPQIASKQSSNPKESPDLKQALLSLLAHPNVCSREPIIRQYDHEVQGTSVIKPLMGPLQKAPCDAAVIKPLYDEAQGLVIANGLCPQLSYFDTKLMAICAVDEAIRNAVCTGVNPKTITLLDNFCWTDPVTTPQNPDGMFKLAQLVRCCQGLAQTVLTYKTPLISGKDSMKNDFDDGTIRLSIPPTLLVSAMGKIENCESAISMDFKSPQDLIYLLCCGSLGTVGSLLSEISSCDPLPPSLNMEQASSMYECLYARITEGLVKSAHDLSEGGLGVALAECSIGSGLGAIIDTNSISEAAAYSLTKSDPLSIELAKRLDFALFGEGPGRILVTISPANQLKFENLMREFPCIKIGYVTQDPILEFDNPDNKGFSVSVSELLTAWETMLPF